MTQDDHKFLVDCITTELVAIIMEQEGKDLPAAMETTLNSRTYELLCNPDTGLSWQSPYYAYQLYQKVG